MSARPRRDLFPDEINRPPKDPGGLAPTFFEGSGVDKDPLEEYVDTDDWISGPIGDVSSKWPPPRSPNKSYDTLQSDSKHEAKGVCVFTKETAEPPNLPDDEFFELEMCSCSVRFVPIWDFCNSLLGFFKDKNQCVSDILKPTVTKIDDVTRMKYSIKAHVFEQSMTCTIKIRIYKDRGSKDMYWVEFQRLSGDCVAFNHIYVRVVKFLNDRYPACLQSLPEDLERDDAPFGGALRPLYEGEDVMEFHLKPLLDMAGMHGSKQLQSEAALALADLAKAPGAREALCTQDVFEKLKKLLEVEEPTVAFPAAQAFVSLASLAKSADLKAVEDTPAHKAAEVLGSANFCRLFSDMEDSWSGKSRLLQEELQDVQRILRPQSSKVFR